MKAGEITGRVSSLPTVRRAGRPKKFETVEELEELIEKYFASCFIKAVRQEKYYVEGDEGEEEGKPGHFEYKWVPATDAAGNQLYEQVKQPTVTGLAVALDTTRETLLDYENKPENAAFSDTIKRAKAIIHEYAEQYLFEGKNQTSGIFNLKNNWGWVDRIETDITSKGKQLASADVATKAAAILQRDEDDVTPETHDQQGTA